MLEHIHAIEVTALRTIYCAFRWKAN